MKSKLIFNWVLINELAVGSVPKKNEDLNFLKDKGIKSILSLCNKSELKLINEMGDMFELENIELPDHRNGRAPKKEEIENTMKVIDKLILKGPLYTHCFAGIERSPLICILWLTKKHKLKFQQALDYMMQAHPYTNPLPQQLDIIRSFL